MSRRSQRTALRIVLSTLFFAGLGLALLVIQVLIYPDRTSGSAVGLVEVEIPKGAVAGQVAERLAAAGLLEGPALFRLYAGQRGVASRFKPGVYQVNAPATPRQLIELMVKGVADELVAVTLPEGRNLLEVAELLGAAGIAPRDELVARALDPAFARALGLGAPSLEGYLFPDTYRLRPGTPPDRVLTALVRHHRQVFGELRARHPTRPAKPGAPAPLDDAAVVTLASIVEKETAQPLERPRIAQVFLNRLTWPTFRPHLLQTDPTIVYGCVVAPRIAGFRLSQACTAFDGRIRRIHLDDRDNAYSTYAHEGLPPGPIANPGRASLEAVLRPDGSPYLYFVSRNDGTHVFSATRVEHEAAVVKYQRGGKPLVAVEAAEVPVPPVPKAPRRSPVRAPGRAHK